MKRKLNNRNITKAAMIYGELLDTDIPADKILLKLGELLSPDFSFDYDTIENVTNDTFKIFSSIVKPYTTFKIPVDFSSEEANMFRDVITFNENVMATARSQVKEFCSSIVSVPTIEAHIPKIVKNAQDEKLSQELDSSIFWVDGKKDYSQLLMEMDTDHNIRSIHDVIIHYTDGRIIGYHSIRHPYKYILGFSKRNIYCEEDTSIIKDEFYDNIPYRRINRERAYQALANQVRSINIQSHILDLEKMILKTYFNRALTGEPKLYWSINDEFCLPSNIEDFLGISPPIEDDYNYKSESNNTEDNNRWYEEETFYALTGGQSGSYEENHPRYNKDGELYW